MLVLLCGRLLIKQSKESEGDEISSIDFMMILTTQKASVLKLSFFLSLPLPFKSKGLWPLFL
jgi:hypothetical protein